MFYVPFLGGIMECSKAIIKQENWQVVKRRCWMVEARRTKLANDV